MWSLKSPTVQPPTVQPQTVQPPDGKAYSENLKKKGYFYWWTPHYRYSSHDLSHVFTAISIERYTRAWLASHIQLSNESSRVKLNVLLFFLFVAIFVDKSQRKKTKEGTGKKKKTLQITKSKMKSITTLTVPDWPFSSWNQNNVIEMTHRCCAI